MSKQNKICQSCGMPMNKDPQGGGTNSDASKNTTYCSYCYQDGQFTFIGTVDEFQESCRKIMIEKGHNRILSWLFTRGMKRLDRWKNN